MLIFPVLLYFPHHSMWEVLSPCGDVMTCVNGGARHLGWWLVHAYGRQSKLSSGAPLDCVWARWGSHSSRCQKGQPWTGCCRSGFLCVLSSSVVAWGVLLCETLSNAAFFFSLQCVKPYPFCFCSLLPLLSKWNKHSTPQPTWNLTSDLYHWLTQWKAGL